MFEGRQGCRHFGDAIELFSGKCILRHIRKGGIYIWLSRDEDALLVNWLGSHVYVLFQRRRVCIGSYQNRYNSRIKDFWKIAP